MRILDRREDLGLLCNELGIDTAVEIGTHQGVFADMFLARFTGRLTCVDPWDSITDQYGNSFAPAFVPNVTNRAVDFAVASAALCGKYPGRVRLFKETSEAHAERYPDGSIGFVYIDSLHTLPFVAEELSRWWPKIKPGGVLAGHDYAPLDPNLVGVSVAVNAFTWSNNLGLCLTRDDPPSWYFRKPL